MSTNKYIQGRTKLELELKHNNIIRKQQGLLKYKLIMEFPV
jgi:hypothetical protein